MGNSQTSMNSGKWNFIKRDQRFQIYQNQNGDLAEKHVIPNDPRASQQQQLSGYFYRYQTNLPLVKVYKAEYDSQNSDFCSNYKNILVFSQYIPYRLAQTRNLSHQQGVYVLSQCLIGYHDLFNRLGPFEVDDTMIGFNQKGQCKVWHNPNFASNHFQRQSVILESTRNPYNFDDKNHQNFQTQMVQDIWSAVDQHATFNQPLRQFVSSMNQFNFDTLKQIVDQQIERNSNIPASLRFQDRNGILQSSRGLFQSNRLNSSPRLPRSRRQL